MARRHRSALVWEGRQLFPAWREKVHTVLCFVFSTEQSSSDRSQASSAVCQSPALFMDYARSPSTSLRCFQLLSAATCIAMHCVKPKWGSVKDLQGDVHALNVLSVWEGTWRDPKKLLPHHLVCLALLLPASASFVWLGFGLSQGNGSDFHSSCSLF